MATVISGDTGIDKVQDGADMPAGCVLQVVNYQTGAVVTGTTTLPFDQTIPQITEGDQYLSLAITPRSATSKLMIDVVLWATHSVSTNFSVALFQDSTANALAAVEFNNATGGAPSVVPLKHFMVAGTASATTFKVRAGGHNAGTTTVNGTGGSSFFNGVGASSITITEIAT